MTEHTPTSIHRTETLYTLFKRLAIIALVLLAGTIVYLQLATTLEIREQQKSNLNTFKLLVGLSKDIRSCTDPAGECARRGQESQSKAVASLNQYGLFVVTCADQPGQQTETEIRACADRLMKASKSPKAKKP